MGQDVGVVFQKWAWSIKSGPRGRKWRIRQSRSGQDVGVVFQKWAWPIKSGHGSSICKMCLLHDKFVK